MADDRPRSRRLLRRWLRQACCSSEIRAGLAVFGVAILKPRAEFRVVLLALLSAVTECVVAQIKQPPPLRRTVGRRAMRRVAAEDGDVSRCELENDASSRVDRVIRQLMIVAVLRAQTALTVVARKHLGCAVAGVGEV